MQQPPSPSVFEQPLVRGLIALALMAALAVAFVALRAARDDGGGAASITDGRTPVGSVVSDEGLGALDGRVPQRGQLAPDFVLRDSEGQLVRLSDLRGSVVWVNFWATWCVPCKKELPAIQRLYDEKRGEGLVVLAINWQEPRTTAQEYFADRGLTLPLLFDSGSVYDQYKLRGLPDSFFIDREGRIATFHLGELDEAKARERLADAGLP